MYSTGTLRISIKEMDFQCLPSAGLEHTTLGLLFLLIRQRAPGLRAQADQPSPLRHRAMPLAVLLNVSPSC